MKVSGSRISLRILLKFPYHFFSGHYAQPNVRCWFQAKSDFTPEFMRLGLFMQKKINLRIDWFSFVFHWRRKITRRRPIREKFPWLQLLSRDLSSFEKLRDQSNLWVLKENFLFHNNSADNNGRSEKNSWKTSDSIALMALMTQTTFNGFLFSKETNKKIQDHEIFCLEMQAQCRFLHISWYIVKIPPKLQKFLWNCY